MTSMASLYSFLFFLTPLLFSVANSEAFELPKMYFVYGLTLVIILVHITNYLQGKAPLFRRTFLDIPLILFLASQIISTVFSIDPHASIFGYYSRLNGGLLSLLSYSFLYWILVIYIDDKLKQKIILYSLISGLLISTYGILEHFGIDAHYWRQDVMARVFSTFGQPNWLAAYLCILLPLSLDKSLKNKLFIPLPIIFYICLLYTKSQSGIIAAVISLGIYSLIYLYKNRFKPSLSFVFCVLSFVFLSLTIANPIKDKLFPAPIRNSTLEIRNSLNITPSEDIRKIVWQGAIDLWRQFPIFGTGPETFADTYYWTRAPAHNLTSEWNFLYNKAHNEYLNYLATTGSFGFITYIILIIFILYSLRNSLYLIPFITILITNFAGFSIVVTSLYFFLLPVLILPSLDFKPTLKKSFYVLRITFYVLLFLFLESKVLFFYLADLCYAQSESYDNNSQYSEALSQIKISLNYRPDEPLYIIEYASISSKLALTTKDTKYITPTLAAIDNVTQIAPFSLNSWKEKAQIYYYLSTLDAKYYLYALDALTKATKLAPTDASSFYMLGEFYDRIKEVDKAAFYYQQAIDMKSNYDYAYFALGKIYFDQQKYSEAKNNFEKVLQIAPANLEAKDYLAQIATISSRPR